MVHINKHTKTKHVYNDLTWLIQCNLEFFLSLWQVSFGFIHQTQRSFEWKSSIEQRLVMVAEFLASPLFIIAFSEKLLHFSSWSFFSFFFLTLSNALALCNFNLQLLCKNYISGPFPKSNFSETVPKSV